MKVLSLVFLLSILTTGSALALGAAEVPYFMRSFVIDESKPVSKEKIAIDNVYVLNADMFTIYDRSLEIYKKNFLDNHPLIMGLFSGKGGRFILYRPGQPPLEPESVPFVYQVAKSVGHCAMATFTLLAPYTADPSADLAWLGSLKSYRTNVQTSLDALDAIDVADEVRELLRDTLKQIAAFMDTCIQKGTYTYHEIESFDQAIKPNLARLIDVRQMNAQICLSFFIFMAEHGWPAI